MSRQSHYSTYNVMDQQDAWDEHTQQIVQARLIREISYRFLTTQEAEMLRAVCSLLADDSRGEIIQYVLCHIDDTLYQGLGEGQRQATLPKEQILVREGLRLLNAAAQAKHLRSYFMLDEGAQRQYLTELSEAAVQPWEPQPGTPVPQKALLQKLLSFTVDAYYSHPQVWSEIGYGGPAYPRGYIRTAIGQTDPWEAKKE